MKNIVLAMSVVSFFSFVSFSESQEYSPDVNALFMSSMVVTCKVIPDNHSYEDYQLQIFNVLHNKTAVKLQSGDTLNMKVDLWDSFGAKGRRYAAGYVLYIYYYEDQKLWYVWSSQNAHPLKKGNIPFTVCDTTYYLKVSEYRRMAREMFKTFEREDYCHYKPIISKDQYEKRKGKSEVVSHFFSWYDNACFIPGVSDYVEPTPAPVKPKIVVDDIKNFCEEPPTFLGGEKAYYDYTQSAMPDSIRNNELGVIGTTYVRFVVEKDSTLSNFEIMRSIYSDYDKAIKDLIMGESMPTIIPGRVRGKAARCRFTIPVRIQSTN